MNAHHQPVNIDQNALLEAFSLANYQGDNDQKVTRDELKDAAASWSLRIAQLHYVQQHGLDKQGLIENIQKRLQATQYLLAEFNAIDTNSAGYLTHEQMLSISL